MASSPSSVLSAGARAPDLIGCEEPRVWTPPLRKLTPETSAGFECIAFAEDVLGISLFPWQRWLLIHSLELLDDDAFRFRTVVLLVARQNGKSTLMQVLSLWRMFIDGAPLVIGTAQNLDVAEEQWQGAVEIAESIPDLAAEVGQVSRVNGKKFLRLVSRDGSPGGRYKVAAASRKGGRGLSGDLVLLDELREHHNWMAWGAVSKTTMARARAQVWCASNAGDLMSVVLNFLRHMAHVALGNPDGLSGMHASPDPLADEDDEIDDDSLGIFEWSALPGCGIWDRKGWQQANPSLGHPNGIGLRAIKSAARTDPETVFRTEVLCQFIDDMGDRIIPANLWDAVCGPQHAGKGAQTLAVDVNEDRDAAAIVAISEDGVAEVLEHRPGLAWVLPWIDAKPQRSEYPWAVDASGPAGALVPELSKRIANLYEVRGGELSKASASFYDAVADGTIRVRSHPALDAAVAGASRRTSGDSWAWSRSASSVDISPLVAVTIARWAALQSVALPEPDFQEI